MDAFKDNDRLVLVLGEEKVKTFEYQGKQALVLATNEKLEEMISEGRELGSIEALKAPTEQKKDVLKEKSEKIGSSQATKDSPKTRPVFGKDIETASLREIAIYLMKLKNDEKAKRAIEKMFGRVSMDFVVHCKGERDLKRLMYAVI